MTRINTEGETLLSALIRDHALRTDSSTTAFSKRLGIDAMLMADILCGAVNPSIIPEDLPGSRRLKMLGLRSVLADELGIIEESPNYPKMMKLGSTSIMQACEIVLNQPEK